nr:hypothetical protein [uncultured Sphingorhabdus sp.]
MKKITFLVISLMTSASANAQTNSIYIAQVGDDSTINLTQEGQSNKIGDTEAIRFVLEGDKQTVTVKQDGNNNVIKGSVLDAASIEYDTTVTGDNNDITYDQGASGSIAGSKQTLTITGDSNDLTFSQGTVSSATDATQTISITGDTNTLTSTINTDDVVNTKTIAGSGNVITTVQNGLAGKNIEMLLTGSTNNITVNQKSEDNVDTIKINSTSIGSTLIINQCNTGDAC